jgi:hypothetical protein
MKAKSYKMKVETDVYVTMRDGVRIGVRVYRPDAEGQFPVLFAASPYQYDTDDLPHSPLFLWREVGPVEWYVSHGYAYVHADVRGTGKSEGTFGLVDRTEQQDLYELVEWAACRPWSSGKVGGIGQSYYAWSQWFMGIVNPPHLKCIAPYDGAVDMYRDVVYHGGVYGEFMTYWANMVRANNLHRAANRPGGKLLETDLAREFITRQCYDDWWRERAPFHRLGEIKVPVLSIGHWGKMGLHLRGNILGYERVKAPKKLVVTGARDAFEAHDLFDKIEFHEKELLPFYDRHLKGVRNGFMDGPPVKLYVRGAETWRDEAEWPLKRAKYVPYYLRRAKSGSVTSLNDGSLATDEPGHGEGTTRFAYPDPRWKLGVVGFGPHGPDPVARVLTFTTAPLDDDVEVTGPIVLELYAASDQIDTDFVVKLSDQQPQDAAARKAGAQPAFTVVSKGWLRAAHREKDEKLSTPQRPFYTHVNPQPLEPDRVYKFEIEVMPASYLFKKGHRIRLEIANGDSPLTDQIFNHLYLPYKVGTDTIHHSATRASRLLLPVVGRAPAKPSRSARIAGRRRAR